MRLIRVPLRQTLIAAPVGMAVGLFATTLNLHSVISYHGCVALFALTFAVMATALAVTFGWRRSRFFILSSLVALELVYCAVAFLPLPEVLMRGLTRDDRTSTQADAVYVFSSTIQDNGEFTDIALSRLIHGLELSGTGKNSRLILSELAPPNPSYADPTRRLMQRLGIQRELMTIGPVGNSRDEALMLAKLFKEKKWKTVLAVTSPLHSHRACALLEREGLTVICSPSAETRFDLSNLTGTQARLIAFGDALYERVAAWIYRYRKWL